MNTHNVSQGFAWALFASEALHSERQALRDRINELEGEE